MRVVNAPLSQQTEDGLQWVTQQVYSTADELGLALDNPPEWNQPDPLDCKMAVEIGGQRKVLKLWRPHIDDSQGGNNAATREIQQGLQKQIRDFLQSFASPKRQIGF